MSNPADSAVPTRIPSSTRKLPFLRKKSVNKKSPASHKQYSPVSPFENDSRPRLQQQETWPDLNAAAASPAYEQAPELPVPSPQASSVDHDQLLERRQRSLSTSSPRGADDPAYDLKPPPPTHAYANIESLAGRLFSIDHLDTILGDHVDLARFSHFLNTYRAQYSQVLKQYIDAKKAILAVEYANTVAGALHANADHRSQYAASLDRGFQAQMNQDVDGLINDALPAYITHRLTQLVTDHLVKDITQNSVPIMKELIPNLAEVYCMTDPSLPDNPIVYASQGFYNVSQYGRDYVIGRNCRFLQGPKTSHASLRRLVEALQGGQEICETLLNYRRDGSSFMNLLLIAPLYDNKGHLRYFLGCQIDVSPLIDRGRGLESFEQLLSKDRSESRYEGALAKDPKYALARFGKLLSEDETSSIASHYRASLEGLEPSKRPKEPRRIIGMDDVPVERQLWPHPSLGSSGRLPGVYQNYLLVRPFPSLRITFASPMLRIPGLLQTKFLDRIGGPAHVRESILDSLAHGTGLTARITWIPHSVNGVDGPSSVQSESRQRWIHCTPLLGSDERVGVWMVVIVESEEITGALKRPMPASEADASLRSVVPASATTATTSARGRRKDLYAEYLINDEQSHAGGSDALDFTVDDRFPDF